MMLTWCAKKQKVAARSSTESEYRSLALATTEVIWHKALLQELHVDTDSSCAVLWCDNIGAGSLASNPVFHSRTKHIEVDVHFIREKIAAKEVDVRHVPTEHQVSDILTKPLYETRFVFLRDKLTINNSQFRLRGSIESKS